MFPPIRGRGNQKNARFIIGPSVGHRVKVNTTQAALKTIADGWRLRPSIVAG